MTHLLAYIGPALLALGASLGGVWTLLPVAFIFGLLPVLDERVGSYAANPPAAATGPRWRWDLALWVFVPVQTAAILLVLHKIAQGDAPLIEMMGLTVSLGVISGSGGIVIAHELMHRASRFPRFGRDPDD